MQEYHICHVCGGLMYPKIESLAYKFNGQSVMIDDAHVFQCVECGEEILESEEAHRIENIVLTQSSKN